MGDERGLAERAIALGGGVTLVVAELSATTEAVGIDLVRLSEPVYVVKSAKRNHGSDGGRNQRLTIALG